MLFLVDDQHAEVLEADGFGQQGMRADHDVDGAARDAVAGLGGLLGADKTRQGAHLQREAAKAFGEAFVMLPGEQCRGRDHRHLNAGHGGDKGGAHRHLCLAKTDIAADQPIHGLAGMHVGHHILDGAQLVVGFLIGKARGEGVPRPRRRVHDRRLAQGTFRRDADQPVGHLADAFLELGLLGLPCPAAQTIQQTFVMAVSRQQFDILDRQIKPRAFGIIQQQAFMRGTGGGDDLHPLIATDAVIDMHHQISGAERLRLGQKIFGLAAFLRRADQPVAQHILFGNDSDVLTVLPRTLEPVLQRPDGQMQAALANAGGVRDGDGFGKAFVFDQPGQAFARTL